MPLKRIDTISIAEGLIKVLAHTGIPKKLLSDQGTVFTGVVMKETCYLLNINKLQMTPYHSQSNDILERWYRDLKGMFRKRKTNDKNGTCS